MEIVNDFVFWFAFFFTAKHYRSRWENLDHSQYRFQPIKFMNLVVPNPYETEPYNNINYVKLNEHLRIFFKADFLML